MTDIAAPVKTIKKPTVKKTAVASLPSEPSHAEKVLSTASSATATLPTETVAKVARKVKSVKTVAVDSAAAPVVATDSVATDSKKKAKGGVAHTDSIITSIIQKFNLNEKEVITFLNTSGLLQNSSQFKKSNKRIKIEGQPKKAMSSFFFFSAKMRNTVKKDLPENCKELASKLGEMWRNMTPEQKQEYVDESNKDRVRYSTEHAAWLLANPEHAKVVPVKKDYANDPEYVLNPASSKWVKKSSSLGKKILNPVEETTAAV